MSDSATAALRREHASTCEACARILLDEAELGNALALGLPEAVPGPELWERIAAEATRTRFVRFAARCAKLIDQAVAHVEELLGAIDMPERWAEASPGVAIFHFEGGPATAGAITGFVRLEPGGQFPKHEHLGHEWNLVLEGALQTDDGRVFRAGQELEMEPGTEHVLSALPGEAVIYLAVSLDGISMSGEPLGPDDPRA